MNKLNPVEKSNYINRRYKEYLRSSFAFGNDQLQKLFEEQLEKEKLFKGPYVALELPFFRGKNIRQLVEDGVVCQSFLELSNIDFERPLYAHQEEALRLIGSGRSAVITTGTGSGKTECFLYPILNDILSDVEKGNKEAGVRAIFLYPMNALVNDQIERVREILVKCPDITYGFYTGDTPEKVSKDYRQKHSIENNTIIPKNELVSREEIRERPPHLLFTNYSMLEYLLIRPNDYSILNPSKLKNWKYVVLDESHTYCGSLGIELSMLMRRLTGLADKKPRFILTSATLGKQGESEKEIVDFAKNLTSADFDERDIIFSKRIPLCSDLLKGVSLTNDYIKIKQEKIDAENLYELLKDDLNVYQIYKNLKDGSKSFDELLESFNGEINEEQLTTLIDLVNQAQKQGVGLFDLKYHSFVRPLFGAYVTWADKPKLSLTKTNVIDGLKAFEVGNCRYCNSPYIIGKILYNSENGLNYLYQNSEIDIYENYGDNISYNLDYFLIENSINEEEVDHKVIEKYTVCAKCGALHPTENKNADKCGCGDNYEFTIYRVGNVAKNDEIVFNNISQCPCCGHRGTSGVVRSLNLGKDEGTALIAQILLEALDEGESTLKKRGKITLTLKSKKEKEKENEIKVKQFLSFSDSRQQASFAAAFMDSNHMRMLQKRIIWQVIKEHQYEDISVEELVSNLSKVIKEKELMPEGISAYKFAWISVLIDLLKVDGNYDSEALGLYYFDLDVSEVMDCLDEEDVEAALGEYKITKQDLATLMQVVLSVFKTTPAIDYIKASLSPDEKREYLEYRRFDNYVMYQSAKTIKNVKSFLPVKQKENMVVRYVKKVCGCNTEKAIEIMQLIFHNLAMDGNLLKKHDSKDMYKIEALNYVVKNYKTSKYYKCSKCGRFTPYNVHDVCVQDNCNGRLVEANPDEVLINNYYRNQYKTKKIERIVIKEHTAQLDRKKAKRYQQEFKNKLINILSCSTTFEMGVDIGSLETVYMRNVPPSPANYVQRAGRAGRRKDSSAYILTYCGMGSHDYNYFCNPEKMISGVIRPPYFDVVNKKIIQRHLVAAYLGYFFRHNEEYFTNLEKLVFEKGVEKFKDYVKSHPQDLNTYVNTKVIPEKIYNSFHDFKWFDELDGNDEKMGFFNETILNIFKEYTDAMKQAAREENYKEADYYSRQIENIKKEKVLDSLSKYCVIPKYGFPVDAVDLQIYEEGVLNSSYDLNRDLKIAISEYAPDSEVIVDKKKYTSKYITLPKVNEFPKKYFCTCAHCLKLNVFNTKNAGNECRYCGQTIETSFAEFYIEPKLGFKTGLTKEVTRMKPKKSYSGEVSYLGGGIEDENILNMNENIVVKTSTNDSLLVMNKSTFYMCPVCGYSELIKENVFVPTLMREHKNVRQFKCSCSDLERIRLAHSFQTDVARFIIPALEKTTGKDYAKALSFMYAFLEGISKALDIERRDIDGIVDVNLKNNSYDILIYDNVPGGAGHVKRLMSKDAIINSLYAAYEKVSNKCCDENTSCYNCLRNYYNQVHHSKLQRKYAIECIETLLDKVD